MVSVDDFDGRAFYRAYSHAAWGHFGGVGCLLAAFTYRAAVRHADKLSNVVNMGRTQLLNCLRDSAVRENYDNFAAEHGIYLPYMFSNVAKSELMDLNAVLVLVEDSHTLDAFRQTKLYREAKTHNYGDGISVLIPLHCDFSPNDYCKHVLLFVRALSGGYLEFHAAHRLIDEVPEAIEDPQYYEEQYMCEFNAMLFAKAQNKRAASYDTAVEILGRDCFTVLFVEPIEKEVGNKTVKTERKNNNSVRK